MDTDKIIRWSTVLVVAFVTGIAAVESYHHITHVSHSPLLAFSIDGMIVASTLVTMAANRAKLETVWLAYVGLWIGIAMTLVANVLYGIPGGLESAVWAVLPAVCFVVTVETISQLSRRKRKRKPAKPVTAREAVDHEAKLIEQQLERNESRKLLYTGSGVSETNHPELLPKVLPVEPRTNERVMGLQKIGKAAHVGLPEARKIQAIMVRDDVDVYVAKATRETERKAE